MQGRRAIVSKPSAGRIGAKHASSALHGRGNHLRWGQSWAVLCGILWKASSPRADQGATARPPRWGRGRSIAATQGPPRARHDLQARAARLGQPRQPRTAFTWFARSLAEALAAQATRRALGRHFAPPIAEALGPARRADIPAELHAWRGQAVRPGLPYLPTPDPVKTESPLMRPSAAENADHRLTEGAPRACTSPALGRGFACFTVSL